MNPEWILIEGVEPEPHAERKENRHCDEVPTRLRSRGIVGRDHFPNLWQLVHIRRVSTPSDNYERLR